MPQYVDADNRIVEPKSQFESTTRLVRRIVSTIKTDTETGEPLRENGEYIVESVVFDHSEPVPTKEIAWNEVILRDKLKAVKTNAEKHREQTFNAKEAHAKRLSEGVKFGRMSYPCTEKDQAGVQKILSAFRNHETLYREWTANNEIRESETQEAYEKRMLDDNVTDPGNLHYDMLWSNGQTLALDIESAAQLFAAMTLYVNASFKQLSADLPS